MRHGEACDSSAALVSLTLQPETIISHTQYELPIHLYPKTC